MMQVYNIISELLNDESKSRASLIALVFLIFYPLFLLTCYMADKGFFVHEIFSGVLGFSVPFVFMAFVFAILLPLLTALLWGGVIAFISIYIEKFEEVNADYSSSEVKLNLLLPLKNALKKTFILSAINIFLVTVLLYSVYTEAYDESVASYIKLMVMLPLILGLSLIVLEKSKKENRVNIYWMLLALALLAPIFGRDTTTNVVEAVLVQFRLGGVMVNLVPMEKQTANSTQKESTRARLLFLSNSNLYLEAKCPRKLLVVPRSDAYRMEFAEIRTAGLKEFTCPETND